MASLKWLVGQGADVHAKSKTGSTPLHSAGQEGQVASMEWLVGQGVDIHAKDQTGHTMLQVAAHQGQVASLKWLVRQGADVHAKDDKYGRTALHYGCKKGHATVVRLLLAAKADTIFQDNV